MTEVTELEEDMIEDWRESEAIVLAANSNADFEDAEDIRVSVSTYLLLSSSFQNGLSYIFIIIRYIHRSLELAGE